MRQIIGGKDSSLVLHQELRSLSRDERSNLFLDAGQTIDIPPEQGLAMKADLAIPWNKLRVIRRLIICDLLFDAIWDFSSMLGF